MDYLNGISKNSIKQNITYLLAICGAGYIVKSSYDVISSYFKDLYYNREISKIIENEKAIINQEKSADYKLQICFYLYYKILQTVYKKELSDFDKKRRYYFELDYLDKYISCVEEFLKNLKLIEQNILQIVNDSLRLEGSNYTNQDKFNINEIKNKYLSEKEIEIPITLDEQKLKEVISELFEKTKSYVVKLRDHNSYKDDYIDDKLKLLAEYMAFDYIYKTHNLERQIIEKAIMINNLSISVV